MSRTWKMPREWNRREAKRPQPVRIVANSRWHKMVQRRRRLGLTSRGTVPKRAPNVRLTKHGLQFVAMDFLRFKIDHLAAALARTFEHLDGPARAAVLELEQELSKVRKELLS